MADTNAIVTPQPIKIAANIEEAGVVFAIKVAEAGDDFRVKILRRSSPASPPESVAIFDGATAEQLLNPEPWLSKFAGGSGFYTFRVVHSSDRTSDRACAIYALPVIPGNPTMPNLRALKDPSWNGPKSLHYASGMDDQPPRNGAPKETNLGGSPDGTKHGAPPAREVSGDGGAALFQHFNEERRKLDEERHRMEMDALRRSADEDRKRLETKFSDMMERVRESQNAPKVDPTETITKIVAAVAAALTPILPMVIEGRKSRAAAEEARLARESEREAKREAREASLMEKISSSGAETAKVVSVFTDSLAQTARAMVQTVAMVGELRQPEQAEPGIMEVIKAAIGAWAESAARAGAPLLPGMTPQPQPPRPPPPQAAPAPTQPAGTGAPSDEGEEVTPAEALNVLAKEVGEKAPIEDLAPAIVDAFTNPDFVAAVRAEGGTTAALRNRLGEPWAGVPENVQYLQALLGRVVQIARQRGVAIDGL